MKISAIICTYNRSTYLQRSIQSLADQTFPRAHYEILVIDNGSTDNTKAVVKSFEEYTNLIYIHEPTLGLSQARNAGLRYASGEYIAFLDDDAIASSHWLYKIVDAYESVKPRPGSVGGKVLPIWEKKRPNWLPRELEGSYTIIDWADEPTFLTEQRHFLAGTNVSYPRDILIECGGFNECLGRKGKSLLSNEEILVNKYIREHDLKIFYDPDISVHHHIPPDRITRRWLYKRIFAQGISDELLMHIESDFERPKYLFLLSALRDIFSLLRAPVTNSLLMRPSISPDAVAAKCAFHRRLGHILGKMQIYYMNDIK